jgi:hypothetical protein
MVTTHTYCVNAIHDVLLRHDNGDMDDNDNIHDEGKDAEAQVVHDNVQQTTNAAMEAPLQRNKVLNNRNQDEHEVSDAQHADDRVKQRSNATMDDPGHMMNELTMTWKLNGWNLIRNLHDQMCWRPPRYHHHVAELILLPYPIYYFFANYLMSNY